MEIVAARGRSGAGPDAIQGDVARRAGVDVDAFEDDDADGEVRERDGGTTAEDDVPAAGVDRDVGVVPRLGERAQDQATRG